MIWIAITIVAAVYVSATLFGAWHADRQVRLLRAQLKKANLDFAVQVQLRTELELENMSLREKLHQQKLILGSRRNLKH